MMTTHSPKESIFYITVYPLHQFIRNNADHVKTDSRLLKGLGSQWHDQWNENISSCWCRHSPSVLCCINWWRITSGTNSCELTALPLWPPSVCLYFLSFLPHFLFSYNKTLWFTLFSFYFTSSYIKESFSLWPFRGCVKRLPFYYVLCFLLDFSVSQFLCSCCVN